MIRDSSPIHRRAEVIAFLVAVGSAIHCEPLPPYAPDLNPVGWRWEYLKRVALRDLA